jgi:hypothetical protein
VAAIWWWVVPGTEMAEDVLDNPRVVNDGAVPSVVKPPLLGFAPSLLIPISHSIFRLFCDWRAALRLSAP